MEEKYYVYKLGHHPEKDGAGVPMRTIIIVAENVENAIKKFRDKYPVSIIEKDLEKISDCYAEEVI